jgi:peptide deformylase
MKLIKSPNPILNQLAEDWDFTRDTDAAEIEAAMVDLMTTNNGIGLAANQVGLLKRVFVIKLQNHPTITQPVGMFNPQVISQNENQFVAKEGCLSFPDLWINVPRPVSIESEYFDKNGNQCIITLTGIDARCFLHELDHLNGVCFTDIISPLKLALAIKKQRKRNGRTK